MKLKDDWSFRSLLRNYWPVAGYLFLALAWLVYSYAFLDLNLTLTSFGPYLRFQKQVRWWGYFHRDQSTVAFLVICWLIGLAYYWLYCWVKKARLELRAVWILFGLVGLVMVLAYPAFSHDVFNYIFNAKMVLVYRADPHQQPAVQFSDPMLGFMRNVHTPAPYFYGWTAISLIPYLLGLGRIFPELVSFKLFSLFWLALSGLLLKKTYSLLKFKTDKTRLTLFLLNPLILIEAVGVGHNDLSMMAAALAAFYFLARFKEAKGFKYLLFSFGCLLFSISVKYATLVLLPLLIIWYFKPDFDLGAWGAVLLFLLPFSRPLDQLHSWYLIWPLTWVFLSKNSKLVYFFCLLSWFALLRYSPYVYHGCWGWPVPVQRLLLYFTVPGLVLAGWLAKFGGGWLLGKLELGC